MQSGRALVAAALPRVDMPADDQRELRLHLHLMNTNIGETAAPARFPREAGYPLYSTNLQQISYSAHG